MRSKISYMAFEKCLTIQELWLQAIYKAKLAYMEQRQYKINRQLLEADFTYQAIITGEMTMRSIAQMNRDRMQDRNDGSVSDFTAAVST